MTAPPFQAGDSEWLDALSRAISTLSRGTSAATAFQEEREDLRVVLSTEGAVEHRVSFTSGVSIRRPGSPAVESWAAGIAPEDLAGLVADDPSFPPAGDPRPDAATGRRSDCLQLERPARELFESASRRAGRGKGVWRFRVTASGFRQRVRVVAAGATPRCDTRQGGWLRLEVRNAPGGRPGGAVVEAVLRGPSEPDWSRLAGEALDRAEMSLGAAEVDPRSSEAVFAPGVGGILVHEVLGHALEGDVVREGESWLAGRSTPVSPPTVTVIDDPRKGRAAWRFDDEGVEARAVPLLLEGCVVGALVDRESARRLSRAPTGHGRRSGFRDPVLPRMGATFLAPGSASAADAIQAVRRGVYVRRMSGARSSPLEGRAIFRVTDAEAIEQGRLSHPVHPFLLEVHGPRSLPTLDAIASDLSFDTCVGSCQRSGQPLSTSVGAPTFRLRMITVRSPQDLKG